jgi:hypothetical protein
VAIELARWSKTLALRSSHSVRNVSMTREFASFARRFESARTAPGHQIDRVLCAVGEGTAFPISRHAVPQTAVEKEHCSDKWSIVSASVPHNGQSPCVGSPLRARRSAVQHLLRKASQA